ncbi:MAG: hypothetical protein SOV61_04470 [Lachnospiraceae bacterium]|nr:hypothetical protein [Lachnospiraceae bacterium]
MANLIIKAFDAKGNNLNIVKDFFDAEGALNVVIGENNKSVPDAFCGGFSESECASEKAGHVDDAILLKIRENGHIDNARLFRRFVLAQMFRYIKRASACKISIEDVIRRNGVAYRWKMLRNEFKAQKEMLRNNDMESYNIRHGFFNGKLVARLIHEHIKAHIETVGYVYDWRKKCRYDEMYNKLKKLARNAYECEECKDDCAKIDVIMSAVDGFREYGRFMTNTPMAKRTGDDFYHAFIKCGMFYTFDNLIKFHGCRFHGRGEQGSANSAYDLCMRENYDEELLLTSLKTLLESTDEFKDFVTYNF